MCNEISNEDMNMCNEIPDEDMITDSELEQVAGGIPIFLVPLIKYLGKAAVTTLSNILVKKGGLAAYEYCRKKLIERGQNPKLADLIPH